MDRIVYLNTNYGTVKIVNLSSVWVNKFLGEWRLMYSDDVYKYNCIYWSYHPRHLLSLKEKLLKAYNNGDTIIEL